jgi:hypothetical protein
MLALQRLLAFLSFSPWNHASMMVCLDGLGTLKMCPHA